VRGELTHMTGIHDIQLSRVHLPFTDNLRRLNAFSLFFEECFASPELLRHLCTSEIADRNLLLISVE